MQIAQLSQNYNIPNKNSSNFNNDSGPNSFENFEKKCMEFFDRKRTDPIEGIWVFSYNGTNYGKYAIKESGEGYLVYAVEKFKCHDISGHITFLKGERSRLATISSKIL